MLARNTAIGWMVPVRPVTMSERMRSDEDTSGSLPAAIQFCHDSPQTPRLIRISTRAVSTPANGNAHAHSHRRRAALVCRTQTEGHDRDQPRRRHADLGATRAQRQPPRPRLCRQGRQARRFRRHRAAQQQCVFRDHLCGVEMRRDADVADLAAAARRGRRRARYPQAVAGGRRPARLECAEFAARRFRAGRRFRRAGQQSGGALLEGDDQRRLDRAAESDPRSPAGGGRYRRPVGARHAARRLAAQSRPALSQRPLHRVAHRAVQRRTRHRPRQIRRRGMLAPDRGQPRAMGQFRADHDAPDLGAARRGAQPLRPVEPADRVSHGSADAAMAEGKMDRVARARAHLRTLWRHRSAGRHDHIGRRMARTPRLGRQDRRDLAPAHHRRGRQRGPDRRDRRDLFPAQ